VCDALARGALSAALEFPQQRITLIRFVTGAGVESWLLVQRPTTEATRALQRTAHIFGTLMEHLPVCVFAKDTESRVTAFSRRFIEVSGCDPEQVRDRSIFDFHPRELAERFRREDLLIMERGRAEEFEDTYVTPNGRFMAHGVKTPVRDGQGGIIGTLGLFWDIGERQRAENALRQNEGRYKALLDNASDAILVANGEGCFVDANRRAEELFGYSRDELLGMCTADLHPPENQRNRERAFRALDETGASRFEHRMRRKDGTVFDVEASGTRIPWGDSHIYLGIFHDIGARKRAESELESYRDRLEQLVERRTRELSGANRELEAFAYSVSHDLRAPLRAINGFGEILREELGDACPDSISGLLNRIRLTTLHMDRLIDGLLKLTQVMRGELASEPVDLSGMLEAIAAGAEANEPQRKVTVAIQPGLHATGDPALLQALLENLFNNAWKFTARRADARIEFGRTTSMTGECYYLKDNGVGFDMRFADRLFHPFERLHERGEFEGTGIGLATVLRIVERHGGDIRAAGEPGRGATFYFTLDPASKAP